MYYITMITGYLILLVHHRKQKNNSMSYKIHINEFNKTTNYEIKTNKKSIIHKTKG